MITKILAKNTSREFRLALPFNSERELKLAIRDFRQAHFPDRNSKSPIPEFYLQYCPTGYSTKDLMPNKNSQDLNVLIMKYGEEDGKLRYDKIVENRKDKGTLKRYIEKYGEESGTKKYYEKNSRLSVSETSLKMNGFSSDEIIKIRSKHASKSARTLDNFISEHGLDEGTKRYETYLTVNHSTHWSVKYWTKRGYSEEDAKIIIGKIQTRDLNYFTNKYGDIDGFIKYEECVKAKTKTSGKSKLEVALFKAIQNIHQDSKYNHLIKGPTRNYLVDIFIESKNLVIECFGDYWHMNPAIYSEDKFNYHLKMSAQEKWLDDNNRIKDLERMGYTVLVLWEKDLNKKGIENIIHESIK